MVDSEKETINAEEVQSENVVSVPTSGERHTPVQSLKCMVVGDSKTGKTTLFKKMVNQDPPTEYIPTVFDVVNHEMKFRDEKICLTMWDSAGSRTFDEIRPISYAHTDCFIICYKEDDPLSLQNCIDHWHPEIMRHGDGPSVPIILVETGSIHCNDKTAKNCPSLETKLVQKKIEAQAFFNFCWSSPESKSSADEILMKAVELAYSKKLEEEKPPNPIWKFHSLKILVAGDPKVGKSSLIEKLLDCLGASRASKLNQREYYHDLVMDGCEYFLRIVELQLQCGNVNDANTTSDVEAVVLCYAVDDPFSFQSVDLFCRNELQKFRQGLPVILVGTKADLRSSSDIIIPTEDGEALALTLNSQCKGFVEFSSNDTEQSQRVLEILIKVCKESLTVTKVK